jgi:hypothetical protein
MPESFDVSRAVGAGLGDRQRARDFIAEFAAAWARPLAPGDGYSEDLLWAVGERLGVRLPAALREAYLLFGRRFDLTARQDPLLTPDRLRMDDSEGVIVFRRENQGCAEWAVAVTDPWNPEDPPVYVRVGDKPWELLASRLSLACAEMVLSEVLLGVQFMGMCDLSGESAAAAEVACRPVSLPEFPLWAGPALTSRWFAAPGKMLRIDAGGPYCWLVAAGQTRMDLDSLCTAIPGQWQEPGKLG